MKWFADCETIEEVKQRYKELVYQYHPDISQRDTNSEMSEINAEYEKAAQKLKNAHKNKEGKVYEKETPDTSEAFRKILESIIRLKGIKVEICGSWLWITGETWQYKDYLKEQGCKWSNSKKAWYWHQDPFKKTSQALSLDEIRSKFGSQAVKTDSEEEQKQIASK